MSKLTWCSSLAALVALMLSCGTAAPLHNVGGSCKSAADCMTGLNCATEDPGGQCEKDCPAGTDVSCGAANLVCNFEKHCYVKCAVTADCARAAEGYTCKDDSPPRAGVKFCD